VPKLKLQSKQNQKGKLMAADASYRPYVCGHCENYHRPVTAENGLSLFYKVESDVKIEIFLHRECAGQWSQSFNIPIPGFGVNASDIGNTKDVIRILIADDQPTILKMVKQILQAHSGFEVVGEARDGRQAVTLAEALKPDVIVLNVNMPTMSGFEAARLIRGYLPDSAIVILSSHKDKQFVAEARKAGARGYVPKSDADGQLIRAINTVVKGEEFFFLE
jgi:CheY-like chemotaxis protein